MTGLDSPWIKCYNDKWRNNKEKRNDMWILGVRLMDLDHDIRSFSLFFARWVLHLETHDPLRSRIQARFSRYIWMKNPDDFVTHLRVSSVVRMCEGTQSKIKDDPELLLLNQSLSWMACRSSSVALVTSCTCLAWTSDLICWTVELDRLTEFPFPNFGRGMRTRWTSLSQVSIFN